METHQTSEVLDRLLDPVAECLTLEGASPRQSARRPDVQSRIEELAEKCNEGDMTPAEQAEYRNIVEAIDFISILQARARVRLARAAGT